MRLAGSSRRGVGLVIVAFVLIVVVVIVIVIVFVVIAIGIIVLLLVLILILIVVRLVHILHFLVLVFLARACSRIDIVVEGCHVRQEILWCYRQELMH